MEVEEKPTRVQGQYWCFTDFTLTDINFIVKDLYPKGLTYIIYGVETCPSTKKKHHQGYMEFDKNIGFNYLKKTYPNWHFEKRKEDRNNAKSIAYCQKEGEYFEWGTKKEYKGSGARSDIATVKKAIAEGCSVRDVIKSCTSYQSIRMCEKLMEYTEKKRNWKPEVYWYWGPTGCGKTYTAVREAGDDYWMSGKDLKWFQGYDGHENVIIDDFRESYCSFSEILRLLDRYPYVVEVKGGSRQFVAKKIWITCPLPPEQVYHTREDTNQLMRRITSVKKFGIGDGTEVGGVILDPPTEKKGILDLFLEKKAVEQ